MDDSESEIGIEVTPQVEMATGGEDIIYASQEEIEDEEEYELDDDDLDDMANPQQHEANDDYGEEGMVVEPQIFMEEHGNGYSGDEEAYDASNMLEVQVEAGDVGPPMMQESDHFIGLCPICDLDKPNKEHVMAHLMPELVEAFQGLTSCPEPDCETLDYYQMESMRSDFEKTRFIVEHHVMEHGGTELYELVNDHELMEEKRKSKTALLSVMIIFTLKKKVTGNCNSKSYFRQMAAQ